MSLSPPALLCLDTEEVMPAHRLDYWRERFSPVWGDIRVEPLPGCSFAARLRSQCYGGLRFNQVEFAGHRMVRRQLGANSDFYSLAFPVAGQAVTSLGHDTVTLQPGNLYLLDNSLDGHLTPLPRYSTFNVQIPTRLIDRPLRQGRPVFSAPLQQGGGRAFMLWQFVRTLHTSLDRLDAADAGFYERQLCELLGFVLAGEGAVRQDDSSTVAAHRRNVMAFIQSHHADEDLSPAIIAKGCGLSSRYLYRIVGSAGQTVMALVQQVRLEQARSALENPLLQGLTVAEVGYRCGFASASEFSRTFKRRYGLPPIQFRRQVRGPARAH